MTRTLVTLVLPIVPAPLATVHTCVGFAGCAATLTRYCAPLGTDVANVKLPSEEIGRSLPPLSQHEPGAGQTAHSAADGELLLTQLIAMLVTLSPATVPEPLLTVQC